MKTLPSIILLQLIFIAASFGQSDPATSSALESEVAKAPEYIAAKIAEKRENGAAMLTQSKILVERFPNSALAHKSMSDAYYYMNFYDEAAVSAEKAIQINTKDVIAWRNLGLIRASQDMNDAAEAAYKTAVTCNENDATPWAYLAAFYASQKKPSFALHCANKASTLLKSTTYDSHNGESPESWAWKEVGAAFLMMDRPFDAAPYLKRSIVLDPDNYDTWLDLAHAFFYQGDRMNALAAAKQAAKISPESKDVQLAVKEYSEEPPSEEPPSEEVIEEPKIRHRSTEELLELAKKVQELQILINQHRQTPDQMLYYLELLRRVNDLKR